MGSFYVYAIVDQPETELPSIKGIGDAPIRGVCAGGLMAVVSPIDTSEAPLNRNNLLCHERVIESLMSTYTVLPARFGTMAEDEERLQKTLEMKGAGYRANLDRVRGRVEIALRVGWETEPDVPASRPRAADVSSGRGYMQALLAQSQHSRQRLAAAEELVAELTVGLDELADELVEKVLPTPRLLLKAAYLVRREYVPEIRLRIEALRLAYPSLAILATGPWPAYSFAE